MDTPSPRVGGAVRALRLAGAVPVFVLGLPLIPVVQRWFPRHQGVLLHLWTRCCLASLGVRVVVDDPFPVSTGIGELVVANHVSWLDGALVGLGRRGRLVVKGEGTDWPSALRGPLRRLGTVFLDRARPETLPATIAELTAVLRAGGRVIAFPEGTSYCGVHSGTFHPALFQSAVDAGAVVRPAEIRYRLADHTTATAAAFIGDDDFGTSVARIVATRGLTAHVTFRQAIPPGAASSRGTLARAAQDSVFGIDSTNVEAGHL